MCSDPALWSAANGGITITLLLPHPFLCDLFLEETRLNNPCRYVLQRDIFLSLRRHTDDLLFVFTNTFLLVWREDKGPIRANSHFQSRCYRGAPALEVKRPKVRRMGEFVMEAKIYTVTLSVIFTDLFLYSLNCFQ